MNHRIKALDQAVARAGSAMCSREPADLRWRADHRLAIRRLTEAAIKDFRERVRAGKAAPKVVRYAGRQFGIMLVGDAWLMLLDNQARPLVGPIRVGTLQEIIEARRC